MKQKSMDVLKGKLDKHPRREIEGRSFEGTPCLELLTLDGKRPASLTVNGYAHISDGQGGLAYAHRAALAVTTGRDYWTEPLVTDHRCHCRRCCNPAHLEWVTPKVNASAERMSHGGIVAQRAAQRANGHIRGRAATESGLLEANATAQRIAVISKHLDTGELRWHRDQLSAARELQLDHGNIAKVIRGRTRRTGRYTFTRFNPEDPTHVILHVAARALDAEAPAP